MKSTNVKSMLLTAMLIAVALAGKAQFSLSGEFRPRAEYRHGFKQMFSEDDTAAFQISQRTRLNAAFKHDKLKVGLSLQDVRFWGETPQLAAASNRLMVHQAWAEYEFAQGFTAKLGRQELVYDDARMLGNVDWAQQARSHDLALLKYERSFKLHLGLAFNQQADLLKTTKYPLAGSYKAMQFLWYNRQISKLSLSVLFMNLGQEFSFIDNNLPKYKTVYSQTAGTRLTRKGEKLEVYGAAYYTFGKDATDRELSAYLINAGVEYKPGNGFGIGAGWELQSGTSEKDKSDDPAGYTNNSFNPYFGTNHKFNGFMDYFYVGNHINSVGLNDIYGNLSYGKNKMSYLLTLHLFSAAADVLQAGSTTDVMARSLGKELDFSLTYQMAPYASLTAGYSQMFGTETLQKLRGGDYKQTNNWAWLMISFKPVYIKEL